jgi:hypothetical protein
MPAPNPPTDIVERTKIAIVAVLAASADIKTITDSATVNITSWNADMLATLPVIAYRFSVATPGGGGTGDTRTFSAFFTAVATTESVANAILEAIENIRWAPALAALGAPLNAYGYYPIRRDIPWDEDVDASRADLEMTFVVTK